MENNKTTYKIENHPGDWTIKNSFISDLGYVMIAFYCEERGVTLNINTGVTLEQALQIPWAKSPETLKAIDPDGRLNHLY